jgi:hypothetical protein
MQISGNKPKGLIWRLIVLQMAIADGRLDIFALEGALVGPPWSKRQNALVFKETCEAGISVYYEPHANHNLESVSSLAPVDVCIVPTMSAYAAGALRPFSFEVLEMQIPDCH